MKKAFRVTLGVLLVLILAYFIKIGWEEYDDNRYKIQPTEQLSAFVDKVTQEHYGRYCENYFHTEGNCFTIVASKIHGIYKQGDVIKVFATTSYGYYQNENYSKINSGASGIIPAAITCTETQEGTFTLVDFTESQDGVGHRQSIENYCVLPSGKKFHRLAKKILNYTDYSDIIALHKQKLDAYLKE